MPFTVGCSGSFGDGEAQSLELPDDPAEAPAVLLGHLDDQFPHLLRLPRPAALCGLSLLPDGLRLPACPTGEGPRGHDRDQLLDLPPQRLATFDKAYGAVLARFRDSLEPAAEPVTVPPTESRASAGSAAQRTMASWTSSTAAPCASVACCTATTPPCRGPEHVQYVRHGFGPGHRAGHLGRGRPGNLREGRDLPVCRPVQFRHLTQHLFDRLTPRGPTAIASHPLGERSPGAFFAHS